MLSLVKELPGLRPSEFAGNAEGETKGTLLTASEKFDRARTGPVLVKFAAETGIQEQKSGRSRRDTANAKVRTINRRVRNLRIATREAR